MWEWIFAAWAAWAFCGLVAYGISVYESGFGADSVGEAVFEAVLIIATSAVAGPILLLGLLASDPD